MALTGGGTAALRKLIATTEAVASGKLTKLLVRDISEELVDLTAERFRTATDPDGKTWAPLRLRSGRPLRDRGILANSVAILRASSREIVVGSPMEYAVYHQTGTGIYGPRKRRIEPVKAKVLAWKTRGAKGTNKRGKRGNKGFFAKSVDGTPPRKILPDGAPPSSYTQAFDAVAQERLRLWFSR